MKRYVILLGVIASGLVHAAAEPVAPAKKMNCADLAWHIYSKNRSDFGIRVGEEDIVDFARRTYFGVRDDEKGVGDKGVLRIRLMYNFQDGRPEKERNSFPCNEVPVDYMFIRPWQRQAFEQGEDLAARAQGSIQALEHCVQESPEYADSPQVKETLASLKQKADLWPQCLRLHRQAIAQEIAKRDQEQGMDDYARQHRVRHDPNPRRESKFDPRFQG